MDPLLTYLTAQQMVGQQFAFPLLQTAAVPISLQASPFYQPAVSTAAPQLIGMDTHHYFKPAVLPVPVPVAQPELLLQLLNNNGLGAVMTTTTPPPQQHLTVAPPPPVVVEKAPPTPNQAFLNLFEQLVAANSLQHPLFVDHASAFAALTATQQQPAPATPLNLAAALLPQPTVLHHSNASTTPTTVYQAPPTSLQAPTTASTSTTTVYQAPITVLPALQQQQSTAFRPVAPKAAATVPPTATVPLARALPVIRIETPEKQQPITAFRVVTPSAAATVTPTVSSPPRLPPPAPQLHQAPIKQEVCSPVKSSASQLSSVDSATVVGELRRSTVAAFGSPATVSPPYGAGTAASTSKSSSVSVDEEERESVMSGEEEERYRPEDVFAGRQRRADHIAFHRKMKALLKGLRGADLVCKVCAVRVERHDNAFKAHIAEHAAAGANQLQCRYCGYETPSRVEMNLHMGDRHPHGSERAYTDKRDHLKMIEIMNECFAKVQRPAKAPPVPRKDPALVKPRMTRKKRDAAASAEEASASATPSVDEPAAAGAAAPSTSSDESFEQVIVRFCTETTTTEVKCACGDEVPLNPSALLQHVKTLHAHYRCSDCGDVLDSTEAARAHTAKMHGGDERTVPERLVDHLMVRSVQQRFIKCFLRKDPFSTPLAKSHTVRVLQNMMDEELAAQSKIKDQSEIKEEVKEEPMDEA